MNRFYFIAIPIVFGILAGVFLYVSSENGDEEGLSKNKLLENGSPVLGNPNAPITILEWGDYQCTYCYRFHESSLDIILNEYINSGKVNLVFKDFPLNGPDSVLAAEASYCAGDQGKYWDYHDELYTNWAGERTGWITLQSLNNFAKSIDVDIEEFNSCLTQHKYRQKVLDLEIFGREIGIDATPSFLVFNDKKIIKIIGNQPIDVFKRVFEELS